MSRFPIDAVTISLPGAFLGYLDGTGVAQGEPYYGDERDYAGELLRTAFRTAPTRKAGKGTTTPVVLEDALSLCILAEYAAMCVEVNTHGDAYGGEKGAAVKVIDRVLATGHVATTDRFHFQPKESK